MLQNLSSAAVVIGTLMVKALIFLIYIFFYFIPTKTYYDIYLFCFTEMVLLDYARLRGREKKVAFPHSETFSRDLTIPHLDLSHFALCIMGN